MKHIKNPETENINFNLDFANFDPEEIETDETINAVFVVDTSYSVQTYVKELNYAFNDFTESMQKSHIAERLFVSVVEFDEHVRVNHGFKPIQTLGTKDFSKNLGGWTALYDGVYLALKNASDYRQNLENSGVETKTLLFVITDGGDNKSKHRPEDVKKLIDEFEKDEYGAFSFTSILFGVGNAGSFTAAQKSMGIRHLAQIGTSGADMKKMIGFISQSVSAASSGIPGSSPIF